VFDFGQNGIAFAKWLTDNTGASYIIDPIRFCAKYPEIFGDGSWGGARMIETERTYSFWRGKPPSRVYESIPCRLWDPLSV
jgi:hypothetical protein